MLIVCESEKSEKELLKPKMQLDVIGLKVYEDVSSFNKTKTKTNQFKTNNSVCPDNMFFVYVPVMKKTFRFMVTAFLIYTIVCNQDYQ